METSFSKYVIFSAKVFPREAYTAYTSNRDTVYKPIAADRVTFSSANLKKRHHPERLFLSSIGRRDMAWAEAMYTTLLGNAEKLKDGRIDSFADLQEQTSRAYRIYAIRHFSQEQAAGELEDYGQLRTNAGANTPLTDTNQNRIYAGYADKALKLLFPDLQKPKDGNTIGVYRYQFIKRLKGKRIKLTETELRVDFAKTPWKVYRGIWRHTDPRYFQAINQHLETLLSDLTKLKAKPETPKKLMASVGKIAEIHWYFSHMMPYERGSSGIGQMIVRSLFEYMNIEAFAWAEDIMPDCEAFIHDLKAYKAIYPSFFRQPPQFYNA